MRETLRRWARGAGHVGLWVMAGAKPVNRFLAGERASVCASCPMNVPGTHGLASFVGGAIAEACGLMRPWMRRKLGTCSGCGCNLLLKVWVPRPRGEPDPGLHVDCWVRREAGER